MIFLTRKLKKALWKKYLSSHHPDINDRFLHSLGVLKKALELRKTFHIPVKKAAVIKAALLHDYAKFCSRDEFEAIIKKYQLDTQLLGASPKLWHSLLGPYIIQDELGINEPEVLDAISHHTIGSLNLTLLGEIIYLADYTDETRDDEYYQEAIKLSKFNFYGAIACKLKQQIDNKHHVISNDLNLMYEKYRRLDGTNYYHQKSN